MNKTRRTNLAKAYEMLKEAEEIIDMALSEELEAYDNLPEGIRDGNRGDEMYSNIEYLEEAICSIGDVTDNLSEILGEIIF